MTVYDSEQDMIRDQIRSAKEAASYLKRLVEQASFEVQPDYLGTETKVRAALLGAIQGLSAEIRAMRAELKSLELEDGEPDKRGTSGK